MLNRGGLLKPRVNFRTTLGGAEVALTCRAMPRVNLHGAVHVDSWNILSLSGDHQLPHLLSELRRVRVNIVDLSG